MMILQGAVKQALERKAAPTESTDEVEQVTQAASTEASTAVETTPEAKPSKSKKKEKKKNDVKEKEEDPEPAPKSKKAKKKAEAAPLPSLQRQDSNRSTGSPTSSFLKFSSLKKRLHPVVSKSPIDKQKESQLRQWLQSVNNKDSSNGKDKAGGYQLLPMLNPDGVIVGNYRCSLMGVDLNRQWVGSSAKFYPVNYHTKLMMKRTLESRDIFFYCDFHGHSIGRNAFMFGNN